MNKFRIGLCQLLVGNDKSNNVRLAREAVKEAASRGASIVVLPECFNSVYAVNAFATYAEPIPDVGCAADEVKNPTTHALLQMSKEFNLFLIGGSIPELSSNGDLYNTCVVASPNGSILAKHRKVHLFDIDVPGGIRFKESETLTAGSDLTTFETPWCTVGVGICYDMRFPQLAQIMAAAGCMLLVYPGAFNMTTGPAHWELLQRARSLDNQCYVATCSPARNPESAYQAWGHSSLVNCWGEVILTSDHEPTVLVSDKLDIKEHCERIRKAIPIGVQARTDLYDNVKWKQDGERKKVKM